MDIAISGQDRDSKGSFRDQDINLRPPSVSCLIERDGVDRHHSRDCCSFFNEERKGVKMCQVIRNSLILDCFGIIVSHRDIQQVLIHQRVERREER